MASTSKQVPDQAKLYKFTRLLTLKLAQVVVQSRQGKKVTQEVNAEVLKDHPSQQSHWFNLCIPDEPEVLYNTKQVINGEVITALSNVLCIEISLKTSEGEEMVLELWSVKMLPESEPALLSTSAIYYRMSTILKSTLTISRITPAYKLSRAQQQESYKINYRIFGGQPNMEVVGNKPRSIKVSELRTAIGTILVEVVFRSELTLSRSTRAATPQDASQHDIMLVSNHFPKDSPKKDNVKKGLDLSRPLTTGAFAQAPAAEWLLAHTTKQVPVSEEKVPSGSEATGGNEGLAPSLEGEEAAALPSSSQAIDVPNTRDQRYGNLMDFPFAGGSPITELANFYQECLQARGVEWNSEGSPTSSDLSEQLRRFEEAVPEFDDMVQSMYAEQVSENT